MTQAPERTQSAWPGPEIGDDYLRAIARRLVREQHWTYIYRGSHPILRAPNKEAGQLPFASTASDWRARLNVVADLKRMGAKLDAPEPRRRQTVTPPSFGDGVETIEKPWTDSEWRAMQAESDTWWRRLYAAERTAGEPEQPAEPSPNLTSLVGRITRSRVREDAKGPGPLSEARQMVREGYSVDRVVERTGWGRMWLADLENRVAAD